MPTTLAALHVLAILIGCALGGLFVIFAAWTEERWGWAWAALVYLIGMFGSTALVVYLILL